MSDGPDTNPLAFELERGEIERGAVAAGLVEPDRGNLPRCKAMNAKGKPCRSPYTLVGPDGLCPAHRPGGQQRARENGKQGARRLRRQLLHDDLPPLRTPKDAEVWLERIGRAVATGVLSASKGQVATSTVRAWLQAHEAGAVTDRLEELRATVAELKGEKKLRSVN